MRILILSWLFLANFFGIDMVLVSGQCQRDQQSLLLQVKNSLVFDSTLSVNLVQWNQSIDCCHWSGVDCDGAGHVINLDLSSETISDGIEKATGLYSLQYLQSLNLAFNSFNRAQIPPKLANLANLTYLNLSNAGFAGKIPIAISTMSSLVTHDLSTFSFSGTSLLNLENPDLSVLVQNLTELRELYLDGVNISADGNEWCQALSSSLPKLQVLSLSSCLLSGPIHRSLANLRSLSMMLLDWNDLSSPVPDFLGDFLNLTSLRLSNCELYGTFPEKILQIPTLETLDLSGNQLLQGSLPEFPKNHSLRTLMLSSTNFSGTVPDSIGNLKNLSRIEVAGCRFTGSIPTSMANLTQLVYLDLSSNNFTGVISSIGWEQLSNLVNVDLGNNFLSGSISSSLFALPSLQKLLLANNQFEGQVHDFSTASFSVLDTLDLGGNRLEGPIPMSIFELRKLHILMLPSNKFNGTVQLDKIQRLGNLTRLDISYNSLSLNGSSSDSSFLPQITTLKLASCKLSKFPNLKNQSKLFYLDLSDNQISGEIPNWMWEVGLEYLNLSHNLLASLQQPSSISDHTSLRVLDLHSNQLQGKIPDLPRNAFHVDYSSNNFTSFIPADIGNFMSFTIFFSLANNNITGVIPESLCNATILLVLDMSNNNLRGRMPTCLIKMSENLGVLNLRRNNLNGTLADTFPGHCSLQTLDLNGNQLDGILPKSLASCSKMDVLNLGNNQISDTFPYWLKNISSLHVLVLRSNRFYGNISCPENDDSWPMLQIVDLALNHFSGTLPGNCLITWKAMMVDEDEAQSKFKHLRFQFMRQGNLYYQDSVTVTIKGLEMELVKILSVFTSIDFSNNNFQGQIPEEIGLFKSLHVLNLSKNAFIGPIPSAIGNLRQLESSDLSVNKLSGVIPEQLASLTFLSVLNLSHNNLVGKIPSSTQLQSFLPTSFEANEGLCGPPLTNDCPTNSSESLPSAPGLSNEIDWFFIVMSIGFAVGFGAVVAPLMFSMKVNKWYDDRIKRFRNRHRGFCVCYND